MAEAGAYESFHEGVRLLETGNVHAAAVALERARDLEPEKVSIREALGRAYFRAGRAVAAAAEFERAVEIDPVNDYAHFGLGLSLLRTGERDRARGHLRLATAMRPDQPAYEEALGEAGGGEEPEQ